MVNYGLTLSACSANGLFIIIIIAGSHGLLQQGNPEFDLKRQKLYDHYHPLEIDPTIPLDKKAKLMEEWYVVIYKIPASPTREIVQICTLDPTAFQFG